MSETKETFTCRAGIEDMKSLHPLKIAQRPLYGVITHNSRQVTVDTPNVSLELSVDTDKTQLRIVPPTKSLFVDAEGNLLMAKEHFLHGVIVDVNDTALLTDFVSIADLLQYLGEVKPEAVAATEAALQKHRKISLKLVLDEIDALVKASDELQVSPLLKLTVAAYLMRQLTTSSESQTLLQRYLTSGVYVPYIECVCGTDQTFIEFKVTSTLTIEDPKKEDGDDSDSSSVSSEDTGKFSSVTASEDEDEDEDNDDDNDDKKKTADDLNIDE